MLFRSSENDGELEIVKKLNELMRSDDIILREMLTRVLAVKPKYLILDEPVAGLDPVGRTRFMP